MHGRVLNASNMNHRTDVRVHGTPLRSERKVAEANEDIWDCFFFLFLFLQSFTQILAFLTAATSLDS